MYSSWYIAADGDGRACVMCVYIRRHRRQQKAAAVKLNWMTSSVAGTNSVYDRRLTTHYSTAASVALGGYFDTSGDHDDVWIHSSSAEVETSSSTSSTTRHNHITTTSSSNGSTSYTAQTLSQTFLNLAALH